MKTLSKKQFQNLPYGFQESIHERSQIHCAVANCKTFLKYAKDCIKNSKDPNYIETNWILIGQKSLRPYYEELLKVTELAHKYDALWLDKYLKTKKDCEKIMNL